MHASSSPPQSMLAPLVAVVLSAFASAEGTIGGDSNDTSVTSPYRYGERTRALKVTLLTQDKMKIANRLLLQNGTRWYLQHNRTVLAFVVQGGSSAMYQRNNVFARTEDGQWHKFRNATPDFDRYVSTLPLVFDDMKHLTYDGRDWLGYNRYGECRRFVMRGASFAGGSYALNEDGQWYLFANNSLTARLNEYLLRLPKFTRAVNTSGVERHRARVRGACTMTVANCSGEQNRYAAPDSALRQILAGRRVTDTSDDILAEENGRWSILDREGDNYLKLDREGIGLEKREHLIFARSSDGAWHMFHKVPKAFKLFVRGLPKRYDFGKLVYDGQTWHARNKFGEYERVTDVFCKGRSLIFLTTGGKCHNYGIKYSSLVRTVYSSVPRSTIPPSRRRGKRRRNKSKKDKKKKKKKGRFVKRQ